jgi:outer membrane protein TolC
MRIAPLVAAALLATASPAFAQKAPAPQPAQPAAASTTDATYDKEMAALFTGSGLTAEEAARRARKSNVTVKRKVAETDEAAAATRQINLAYVPQVSGRFRYTRLSDIDNSFQIAPGQPAIEFPVVLNNYSFVAEVGVPLSDYILRFPQLKKASRAGERAAVLARRSAELDADADARVAYYEWVRARLTVVVAERRLAQIERTLEQITAFASVQRASRADLLTIQALRAKAELALAQTRELAALREDQLRVAIGAPATEGLTIGEDVRGDLAVPDLGTAAALSDAAMQRRLDAKALDVAVEAIGYQKKATLADQLPSLSAFGQYNYDNPNQRKISGEEEFTGTWAVGAQLSWSLNDFLGAAPKKDQYDAQARQLLADREALAQGVRVAVLSARQQVDVAKLSLQTTQQELVAAEEAYRVRKELFAAERATTIEVTEAEDNLTSARIAAIDARINLRVALAQLRHAAGLDVD